MSLADDILAGVKDAFAAASEVMPTVSYTQKTPGTYDPTTGSATPTVVNESFKAIVEDVSKKGLEGQIAVNDKQITFQAADVPFVPAVSDTCVISGLGYEVTDADTIYAGDTPAVFILQLKRA